MSDQTPENNQNPLVETPTETQTAPKKTKEIYCTVCREVKEHTLEVDKNAEILATCSVCEHFFKIASDLPIADIKAEIAGKEDAHKDLVTAEEEQQKLADAETVLDEL